MASESLLLVVEDKSRNKQDGIMAIFVRFFAFPPLTVSHIRNELNHWSSDTNLLQRLKSWSKNGWHQLPADSLLAWLCILFSSRSCIGVPGTQATLDWDHRPRRNNFWTLQSCKTRLMVMLICFLMRSQQLTCLFFLQTILVGELFQFTVIRLD